eukprot:TRINITY_DN1250_c0_g1_i1.p1 TRINITY_DN1250_c0_g1~~TRINITY_DN1250_c0_g1_i1.p1  ORF type:complete len:431 (+),score=92.36 TRINITY_DN1250_c0_g1_i1:99-1391(+)
MGGHKFDANQSKVQLKLAISRLKLQKNKKENNLKNQKREISELLKAGKDESARIKVEGVIREDFIIEAYEIIELFCELLLARLGIIQISKDCPPDLREAVSTLIYAAPRTEIKELAVIREQLMGKFGKEFAMDAMTNKDNCVNARVVHKLSVQTPENYLVFQYLNEIARAFNLEWKAEFEPATIVVPQPAMPQPIANGTMGRSNGAYVEPFSPVPSFPNPPNVSMNQQNIPSFPEPPRQFSGNNSIPSFPDVPSKPSGNSTVPNFPTPPSFGGSSSNNVSIPSFDFNAMPGGPGVGGSEPSIPTFNFPTPPGHSSGTIPNFPTPPGHSSGNSATIPNFDFPSVPTPQGPPPPSTLHLNDVRLDFPTPPSNLGGSQTLNFPTPPSNGGSSTLNFPSPPSNLGGSAPNDASSSVPDFDELTARFEKLKKRDA